MIVSQINSWKEWKDIIPSQMAKRPSGGKDDGSFSTLLFRGHSCESWGLESTLERNGIRLPDMDSYAKEIKEVKLAFESYLGSSWSSDFTGNEFPFAPPKDYEFMVYLRHHGYPTPLLDWTRSPYVAAFFAFQHPSSEESVAIFSFREYGGDGKAGWTGNSNIVGCGPTIRTHKRHYIQQAEYTYCRQKVEEKWVYSTHEKALEETVSGQDILEKFVLPASIRSEVLTELDSMNINAFTLFGSEEGLAEMLANRMYINRRN
jgi:hypothetical protein